MTETLSPACILSLDRIVTKDTQARAALSETIITEYAEALERGEEFPPIEVYFDDRTYWLADGFHRLHAAARAGRDTITATVHKGGKREALLYALGANETHGLRRTDADRRHAVILMLNDPEWRLWSNREIARQCHVSDMLVGRVRREIEPKERVRATEETRKVKRGGKVYTMRTKSIGAVKAESPAPGAQPVPRAPAVEQEPRTVPEELPGAPSATVLQIDSSETPAATSQEPTQRSVPVETPEAPPEPHVDVPAPAAHVERTVTPEAPTQPPSVSEPQIESGAAHAAAALGQEPTVEPHARAVAHPNVHTDQETAVHADGAPEPPSFLARTWDAATHEQRRVFVTLRRDELQVFLSALSSPEPATPQPKQSAATRRAKPQPPKQRRQRVSAQNPR